VPFFNASYDSRQASRSQAACTTHRYYEQLDSVAVSLIMMYQMIGASQLRNCSRFDIQWEIEACDAHTVRVVTVLAQPRVRADGAMTRTLAEFGADLFSHDVQRSCDCCPMQVNALLTCAGTCFPRYRADAEVCMSPLQASRKVAETSSRCRMQSPYPSGDFCNTRSRSLCNTANTV
jgi:hypothetical protein